MADKKESQMDNNGIDFYKERRLSYDSLDEQKNLVLNLDKIETLD